MPRRWIRNLVLAFTLLSAGVVAAQAEESAAARSARMKREFEQKSQQMKKDFEKLKKQNSAAAKATDTARTQPAAPTPTQFDPQAAPRPEVCFDAFLRAARSAKSFEEILPYLQRTSASTTNGNKNGMTRKRLVNADCGTRKRGSSMTQPFST